MSDRFIWNLLNSPIDYFIWNLRAFGEFNKIDMMLDTLLTELGTYVPLL